MSQIRGHFGSLRLSEKRTSNPLFIFFREICSRTYQEGLFVFLKFFQALLLERLFVFEVRFAGYSAQ